MRSFEESYRSKVFWTLSAAALVAGAVMLIPFLPALLWATVLSVLIYPLYQRFQKRMPPNGAAGMATIVTLLIIGVPLFLIGAALFVQVNGFLREFSNATPAGEAAFSIDHILKEADRTLKPVIQSLSPSFSFATWFEQNRQQVTQNLTAPIGRALFTTGYTLFTLVVAFLTMFFMLRDGHKLREPAVELLPLDRDKSLAIFERTAATIRAVFIGVVLVAVIQGTIAGITYMAVGVPNAIMWGVATIVLCTIPLLGAPILYIPMALVLLASGNTWGAVILLCVGFIVVSNIDNLLRPFIIGAQVQLHPMAIFFSLLGGVLMLGPVGIMAGPMLLTILLMLQDIVREQRKATAAGEEGPLPTPEETPA